MERPFENLSTVDLIDLRNAADRIIFILDGVCNNKIVPEIIIVARAIWNECQQENSKRAKIEALRRNGSSIPEIL